MLEFLQDFREFMDLLFSFNLQMVPIYSAIIIGGRSILAAIIHYMARMVEKTHQLEIKHLQCEQELSVLKVAAERHAVVLERMKLAIEKLGGPAIDD